MREALEVKLILQNLDTKNLDLHMLCFDINPSKIEEYISCNKEDSNFIKNFQKNFKFNNLVIEEI